MNGVKMSRAIILAAGMGKRLKPLTDITPKPLLKINGKPMIESILDVLLVDEVHIVTGYFHEQFEYLKDRVNLIYNPHFETCNNISSLYMAREYLSECIILDADLIIHNPKILRADFTSSGYCSVYNSEWLQTLDEDGNVISTQKGAWQLYSVSFWTKEDGRKLRTHLEELFPKYKHVYWDDIPHFLKKDEYNLKIREIGIGDIIEIDTFEEFKAYENR